MQGLSSPSWLHLTDLAGTDTPNGLVEDALNSYTWHMADQCGNPEFMSLFNRTKQCMVGSRAAATLQRYAGAWTRFKKFCLYFNIPLLPAQPLHVAMFLTLVKEYAESKGFSYNVVKNARSAIFQAHRLAGLPLEVVSHPLVSAVCDCAKRTLGLHTKNRKAPFDLNLVAACAIGLLGRRLSLPNLQIATFIMVCFAGFLRFSDAIQIHADDIQFHPDRMEIFIEKRKTLQFRQGEVIVVARGNSEACPVKLMEVFLQKAGFGGRHTPIFKNLVYHKRKYHFSRDAGAWSYPQASRLVLRELAATAGMSISEFKRVFGLHSFRSGGVTHAAQQGVPDHLLQPHGGWVTLKSMQGYIQRSNPARLVPTLAMGY